MSQSSIQNQDPPLSFRLSSGLMSLAPHPVLFHASRAVGLLYYFFGRRKRRNYLDNLAGAGGINGNSRPWTAFQNHTLNVMELLKAPSESPRDILKRVTIQGRERLDEAVAGRQGLIVVTIHSGNWELSGLALALSGYPITTIAGEQLNAGWSEMVKDWKRQYGIKVMSPGRSLRELYRDVGAGRFIVLHMDGDMFSGGHELDFLGKRIRLPRGPAHLSRLSGAPVCFAVCRRRERHRLEIRIGDLLQPPDSKAAEVEMTKNLAAIIEKCVLAEPDQWCIFRQL